MPGAVASKAVLHMSLDRQKQIITPYQGEASFRSSYQSGLDRPALRVPGKLIRARKKLRNYYQIRQESFQRWLKAADIPPSVAFCHNGAIYGNKINQRILSDNMCPLISKSRTRSQCIYLLTCAEAYRCFFVSYLVPLPNNLKKTFLIYTIRLTGFFFVITSLWLLVFTLEVL